MNRRSAIIGSVIGVVAIITLGVSVSLTNAENDIYENKLRIAYFPNIGHVIPIVGMEQEFFQRDIGNQTLIETRIFDSGPQVIESLFANSIDIAYVGPGPAINGFLNSNNHNVKILSGAASGGTSFVVHPNSQIKSISDFDGKKIAAPQIGNTQDISLRYHMSEHDLRPAEKGGSVVVYNVSNPDIYTLFVKGDIDGAWVAEPWATILEKELDGTRLFDEEELWPDNEFASVLLIANSEYAEKNPELISKFLESHHQTVQWINQNPTETRIVFNDFLNSYLGQSLPDAIVDTALSHIEITSDPISDSVYSFAKKADALGYLGRNGYDLTGIFYTLDSNYNVEKEN